MQHLGALRWLLLLVFPLVCIPAISVGAGVGPLVYAGVAAGSCGLLLWRLSNITPENVSVWLAGGFIVGVYFLRYAYFVLDPKPVMGIQPDSVFIVLRDDAVSLHKAYALAVLGFAVFCCASAMLLLKFPTSKSSMSVGDIDFAAHACFSKWLFVVIPVLMVVLGFVAHHYHVGQMGVPAGEPLPFRLKGLIFYGRLVLLPLLILTLIYLGDRIDRSWQVRAGLMLLALHGVSDLVLRGSRSSLLLCVLVVVFLAVNRGLRVRPIGVAICATLGIFAIWLMPVIMQYRILRFSSQEDLLPLLLRAFASSADGLQKLGDGLSTVYLRLPGLETLWAMLSLKAEPLGLALGAALAAPNGVTGYLNIGVYHSPPELNTLFAPGYLGWWYLVGGVTGIALGALALAFVCVLLPRWILACGLRCAPVANTFLLWVLFISLSDGTLDSNLLLVGSGMVCLGLLEVGLRFARCWPLRSIS